MSTVALRTSIRSNGHSDLLVMQGIRQARRGVSAPRRAVLQNGIKSYLRHLAALASIASNFARSSIETSAQRSRSLLVTITRLPRNDTSSITEANFERISRVAMRVGVVVTGVHCVLFTCTGQGLEAAKSLATKRGFAGGYWLPINQSMPLLTMICKGFALGATQ